MKCKEYMKIELSKAFVTSYNLYINFFHCGYGFTGTLLNSEDPDLSKSTSVYTISKEHIASRHYAVILYISLVVRKREI